MEKKAHLYSDMYVGNVLFHHVDAGLLSYQEASHQMDAAKENFSLFSKIFEDAGVTRISLSWRYDSNNFIFDSWTPEGLDNE